MCIACNRGFADIARALTDRRGFLGGGLALATAAAVRPAWAAADRPADVLFVGGHVLTMDDRAPVAEAVAVTGDRILAVGSAEAVRAHAGPRTQVVDLLGRTLLPGFIDPHVHTVSAHFDDWLDVTPMRLHSMDEVLAALRAAAASTPAGDWVRAHGFDRAIIRGGRAFTLAELDAIAPDNPLFVTEINGHVAYANSRALALAGVTRDTPDRAGGRFGRDSAGDLTGRLDEGGAMGPFLAKMPRVTPAEMQARLARLFEASARVGCTGLHDCGIGFVGGEHDLTQLQTAMAADPPVRLRGMLGTGAMATWTRLGLKPGFGDDRFRVGGIKVISDGSNPGRTGFMREPYLGETSRGAMNYTPEALTQEIRRAHELGWQVGVHANGDAAIDATLDAFETVLSAAPRADHRHRLEHCSVLHPEQIQRMRRLDLSPSFLIGHVRWWGRAFRDRFLGPERAELYDPCASALRGGLRISLHSDYSVTPLEPLRYVEDATARVMADGGEVLNPAERIPVMSALRAVTLDAAWQCRMDDVAGSVTPGKYADFAILEADPRAVEPTRIAAIPVSETWLNGRRRYAR
jgi:predicted amidohydrolase YtcJ